MASTRSGSAQVLEIAEVAASPTWVMISGKGTGFGGISITPEVGTTESTSAGRTDTEKSGYVVNTGAFEINETVDTLPWFLGKNGKRYMFRRSQRGRLTGLPQEIFTAVTEVTRTAGGRDKRTFSLSLAIDGAIVESVQ